MLKKPWQNAVCALLYVSLVASLMFYAPHVDNQPSVFIPMAVLSLFTLSAAVMGFLFLSRPFELYFENKKKEAFAFFFQTVGIFAGFTAMVFLVLFLLPRA